MAANVLAYFAESESGVKSRRTARGQASSPGAGRGSRSAGLVRTPKAWFMGFNPGPSPEHLAPDPAPLHDVLEIKGVRCFESKCLKALFP